MLEERLAGWEQAAAEPQQLPAQVHAEPDRGGDKQETRLHIHRGMELGIGSCPPKQ